MQKTALNTAAALALATFAAGSAFAQSSLTLYGNADVSLDNVKKTAGVPLAGGAQMTAPPAIGAGIALINGQVSAGLRAAEGVQGVKSSVTRVSPSGTSQTSFGLKGEENLGDGYKASFVLEGQLGHDTGALGQDGRIFGRQSYVGLTTPFGEVRLGRQYAPIFYSTAAVTGERFGATDLFTEGGSSNNLLLRQDNQISYWLKAGGLTGSLAYSPNAGAYDAISASRNPSGFLGANGSGTEGAGKLGRSLGLFANYAFDSALNATFGFHRNEFDGAVLGVSAGGYDVVSSPLDRFQAFNLGLKYVMPSNGTMISATFGQSRYDMSGDANVKTQALIAGIRVPVDKWTFSAQASQIKFTNFTKGKDTGLMFGAEYELSKRTTLYARAVQIRDDEGTASNTLGLNADIDAGAVGTQNFAISVVGGPDVLATALGLREIPVFAGANVNPGGKATYVGVGIRHTF